MVKCGVGRGGKERINPQSTPPREGENCKKWYMDRARTKTPKVHHQGKRWQGGGRGMGGEVGEWVARWEGEMAELMRDGEGTRWEIER